MLFWRGYGILVFVFTVLSISGVAAVAESFWGKPLPIDMRQWSALAGMWTAAAAVYGLHFALDKSSQPRIVIDQQTGEELILIQKHDLFFVPVKYWPYVLLALGVSIFFSLGDL